MILKGIAKNKGTFTNVFLYQGHMVRYRAQHYSYLVPYQISVIILN